MFLRPIIVFIICGWSRFSTALFRVDSLRISHELIVAIYYISLKFANDIRTIYTARIRQYKGSPETIGYDVFTGESNLWWLTKAINTGAD